MADKAATVIENLVPKTSVKRGRRAKVVQKQATTDFFERGWIELKDLPAFEEHIATNCDKISNSEVEYDYESIEQLVDFHVEFELLMIKQVNISRVKYLGFAPKFLGRAVPLLRDFYGELPHKYVSFVSFFFYST